MSNETRWTRGPWRHALRNANEIMTTFHGVQIGRIYIDVTTDNEAEDAHLIAAAPELYESTDMALKAIQRLAGEYGAIPDYLDDITSQLEASMAKARGETS